MKKTSAQSSRTATEPSGWREGRRWRAWELYEQGWQAKKIAEALGVSQGAVSQWLKKGKAGGKEALRHHPSPGRPRKLSQNQLEQVPELLEQGAEAHGFRGNVWTGARVVKVIERHFGVHYDRSHCVQLVKALGYSLQKPEEQATQRKEEEIATWKAERWDALKKSPSGEKNDRVR